MGKSSVTWVCADGAHDGLVEFADSRFYRADGLAAFPDWENASQELGSVWAQTIPMMAGPVVVGFVTLHYSALPSGRRGTRPSAPVLRRRSSRDAGPVPEDNENGLLFEFLSHAATTLFMLRATRGLGRAESGVRAGTQFTLIDRQNRASMGESAWVHVENLPSLLEASAGIQEEGSQLSLQRPPPPRPRLSRLMSDAGAKASTDEGGGSADSNAAELSALDGQAEEAKAILSDWRTDPWSLQDDELQALLVSAPSAPSTGPAFGQALSHAPAPAPQLAMLHQQGLLRRFHLRVATVRRFVSEVAQRYRDNPYHNFKHAFSVAHTAWRFLSASPQLATKARPGAAPQTLRAPPACPAPTPHTPARCRPHRLPVPPCPAALHRAPGAAAGGAVPRRGASGHDERLPGGNPQPAR